MPEAIIFEKKGKIAYITLNRPDVLNAINAQLGSEVADALAECREDPDVWVVIMTGAGDRAFSAGADLKGMAATSPQGFSDQFWAPSKPSLSRGMEFWKPVIAAINGYCMGGGLEMALSCDIRIATEASQFALPEVLRGILPGGGGTQRLPRAIPFGKALEMMLTGDRIGAQEALSLGLVTHVLPTKDELMAKAEELANKLCTTSAPLSVRAIKELAYRGRDMSLSDGLRLESMMFRIIRTTEDSREGPKAFGEKRQPQFQAK